MKYVTLLLTVMFFQTTFADSTLEESWQLVCVRSGSATGRPKTLVITQVSGSLEEGEEIFTYQKGKSSNNTDDFGAKIEMFKGAVDLKQAKDSIMEMTIRDRKYEAVGKVSRSLDMLYFEEDEIQKHQFAVVLTSLSKSAGFFNLKVGGGFKCTKPFLTTYKPLEEPKPQMKDNSDEVHAALDTDEEYIVD